MLNLRSRSPFRAGQMLACAAFAIELVSHCLAAEADGSRMAQATHKHFTAPAGAGVSSIEPAESRFPLS
jgi:hypothetical protein